MSAYPSSRAAPTKITTAPEAISALDRALRPGVERLFLALLQLLERIRDALPTERRLEFRHRASESLAETCQVHRFERRQEIEVRLLRSIQRHAEPTRELFDLLKRTARRAFQESGLVDAELAELSEAASSARGA